MYFRSQFLYFVILLQGILLLCSFKYRGNNEYQQSVTDNLKQSKSDINEQIEMSPDDTVDNDNLTAVLEKVRNITNCLDRSIVPRTQERGDFWVLYNYVPAERSHSCYESITYTTHGDYSFLDNLLPLLERWKGPISLALYAPGTDFNKTLAAIAFLRDCTDLRVKEFVTFHLFFNKKHIPKWVPKSDSWYDEFSNCSSNPPYENVSLQEMYRTQKELVYPINVGRNIARETAQTHFIFASDIELYPSPNIIPRFLSMIAENKGPLQSENPKVFVLHPFEVTSDSHIPENKTVLQKMLLNHTAISFHKDLCGLCHNVPNSEKWQKQNETDGPFKVFHIAKRMGTFGYWEPFYIGTHSDPYFDERLSWEGQSNKMTQEYILCTLDYDFLILDDAYLIHKPGIKVYSHTKKRKDLVKQTDQEVRPVILADLKTLFGDKKGCHI